MAKHLRHLAVWAVAILSSVACGPIGGNNDPIQEKKARGVADQQSADNIPASVNEPGADAKVSSAATKGSGTGSPTTSAAAVKLAMLTAVYQINVVTDAGINICKGDVTLNINPRLDGSTSLLNVPQGIVTCALGLVKIDLAAILNGMIAQAESDKTSEFPLEADKQVIRLKHIASKARFQPARPLLPALLTSTKAELLSLNVSEQVTATDLETNVRSTGVITLKTIGMDQAFVALAMQKTFSNTFIWNMTATGFDGGQKPKMLLFDSVDMVWNLDPIAIPQIKVRTKLKDFIEVQPMAVLPGLGPIVDIIGQAVLTLTLDLKSMTGI